jgi:hypothetical protein
MTRGLAIVALAGLAACTQDVDPAWQLDHDRVITVRSTPPRIAAGEAAVLDALIGHKGAPPSEVSPDLAEVVSPSTLAAQLDHQADGWTVTVPSDSQLEAARRELNLPAGDPVPLRIRATFTDGELIAYKIVWLGEHRDNPVIDPISIDGGDGLARSQLTVPIGVKVPLAVELDDSYNINWLTSCGTMHDYDLATAYLRVEPADPKDGTLGVVVRDDQGGVAWHLWPITAGD